MSTRHTTPPACCAALLMIIALGVPSTVFAESTISGISELKVGGYYPSIDDEFTTTKGPFESFFGTETMWYIENDWNFYLWQSYVKFGLGFSLGYSSFEGDVLTEAGVSAEEAVPGKTSFTVIPIKVSALLRYDWSALHHNIPLVPTARVGVGYYLWGITDASNATSSSEDRVGEGGKFGWHAGLGMQILLDIIEPSSAAYMDMNWGVNHSYLFAEYTWMRAGNDGNGLNLSDEMMLFGLAFEF